MGGSGEQVVRVLRGALGTKGSKNPSCRGKKGEVKKKRWYREFRGNVQITT